MAGRQKYIWDKVAKDFVPADQFVRTGVDAGYNIMSDIEPYQNIIDGKPVGGRRQHREFLKRHGVEEVGNEKIYNRPKPEHKPKGVGMDIKRAIEELNSR